MGRDRAGCRVWPGRCCRWTTALGAFAILAALALPPGSQATVVRDLPGLSGRSVEIVTAAPSPGGESTIVANVKSRSSGSGAISAVRLRADGAPQIGFGRWGVARLPGSGRAVSATVDPQSGRLYVAALVGGNPSILALDASGAPDREFGSGGVVRIPGAVTTDSFRLAAAGGYLFVLAGAGDCAGCMIRELSLPSGALATSSTLSRDQLAGRAGCPRARVGDIALLGGRMVLAVEACGRLLVDIPEPHDSAGKALRGTRIPLGAGRLQVALRSDPGRTYACLASREKGSTRLGQARYPALAGLPGAGGQVQGEASIGDLAAFGSSGCAALLAGQRRASILVADRQRSPRPVGAPGLSRVDALAACGNGLLALGVRRIGGAEQARLVVVRRSG